MKGEQGLFLDDLYVGQRFTSDTYRIDVERIKSFAAEFDPQPFHLDEAAARDSVFGGLAASGWHIAAVAMRLLVTSGLPLANGIIGLGGELTWPTQRGLVILCGWKARSSRFCPPTLRQTRLSLE